MSNPITRRTALAASKVEPDATAFEPDATAFENANVKVRCIGHMLVLMGEGMHRRDKGSGDVFVRLGYDLQDEAEKLEQVLDDLLMQQNHEFKVTEAQS